ncbi:5951_t:CDS:1 [Funneliformis geosporum]|uniref:5951_t:CDS:1 n=1 Tax=Funneliformis geosporum TaxID=1117311 RepID=A0A9W4T523_9GLOM|nr:5951_t:CDS:1 [Funneliformis geosporum]
MDCRLSVDCLDEIFEYLENDKATLYSCILVNRLWHESSVRILWRNIWIVPIAYPNRYRWESSSKIIRTLIDCLPYESKILLSEKGIYSTSKLPLVNYASFCKVLSVHEVDQIIQRNLCPTKRELVLQEILKMFMKQTSYLKELDYKITTSDIPVGFTSFPGAINRLSGLSRLTCSSNIKSEFFHQISGICHNIKSLSVEINTIISNGLKDLISQSNLKHLTFITNFSSSSLSYIIPSLTKLSNTLIKLEIIGISFYDFDNLQHVYFSQLQTLTFEREFLYLNTFLEKNGKNLKSLSIGYSDSPLSIAKFCPNLKSLVIAMMNAESLKAILNSCQQIESIEIWCSDYLSEKECVGILRKFLPKNFRKLKLEKCVLYHNHFLRSKTIN